MATVNKVRTIDPFFEDAINQIFIHSDKTAFVMDGGIGIGKALADSEVVLTPTGFVPMGTLKVGDEVISEDGKPTTVTGVYPQGRKEIFKLTFKQGQTVRCTSDHLWKVKCIRRKKHSVMTTQEIMDYGVLRENGIIKKNGDSEVQYLMKVPIVKGCNIDSGDELPLDPYFMGLLLGDGGFTHEAVGFTNGTKSIVDEFESLLPQGVQLTKHYYNNAWHCKARGVSRCINPLNKIIRKLGLWGKHSCEKHIPECYKNSSLENRKRLLQGLIDTDGHVLKANGNIEFNTSSEQLMKDYCYVARSIGMELGKVSTKIPTYTYKGEKKTGEKSYRVNQLVRYDGHATIVDISSDGYETATCITVDHPSKLFVTNDFILTHNSSNFVMQGAYSISQLIEPIRKGNKMVRESKWAAVRESENSALSTVQQLLGEAIFTPEIMAMDNSPVKVSGSHPAKVTIKHALPDNTFIEMHIECHGFNNEQAHNRLRTHDFLGAMIFEMQGIPFNIFEVTAQRCGRFRTNDLIIKKTINGKEYQLSGLNKLAMVLCDVNIPERPHPLYKNYYDVPDKSKLPYLFITPPSPLIYKPVDSVPQNILDKYPVTVFEGEEVVWLPNPQAYNMTRHFEEKDENGENIPWTGYDYWFSKLHLPDSDVRRYIIGKPDTVGGEGAVYGKFRNSDKTVLTRQLNRNRPIYIGYDPGGHAAFEFCQLHEGDHLHFFNEFYFEPGDRASTRIQVKDYVFPYILKKCRGFKVILVLDPASSWLGKNNITGNEETALNMIQDELIEFKDKFKDANIHVELQPCMVSNQNTTARINSLSYFIDKHKLSADPKCDMLVTALSGGYQKKKLKSGIISDNIDKDSIYSHPAEAAQYPAVNIINTIKKAKHESNKSSKRRVYRVKRTR